MQFILFVRRPQVAPNTPYHLDCFHSIQMGQAASYAESSVQRALLKLKHEEQAEEDELLEACGFRRPTATTVPDDARPAQSPVRGHDESGGMTSSNNPNGNNTDAGSCERLLSSPLPPPPACLAPFVSLAPKYYTLDELRDALRYLPDTLWVSLYRVSLLYILDNDHDGRVNSTDISFFMDWGIKTVGHQVPPEQLAEVLQTYAALHCWHRCLHVGEEIEAERAAAAAAAAAQSSRGGPGGGSGVAARSRRRPLQSVSGGGSSGSAPSHYHNHQQAQSVASFMLLHLREAFFRNRAGGQVPRPSSVQARAPDNDNATTTSTTCTSGAAAGAATEAGATEAGAAGGDGGRSCPAAPQFFSPRSAVTQPVTSATRLEAAAHFAEWMLRLVQNQERDRRHERQRLERRLRWLLAPEAKLNNNNILRHSQLLQHRSVRLRGGSLAMLSSLGDTGDGEDVVTSQPFLPPLRSGVVDMYDVTDAEVVDSDVVVELPRNSSNFAFPSQVASPAAAAEGDGVSAPSSRSVTPLESTSALIKTQHDGVDGGSIDRQTNAPVAQLRDSPNDTTPSPQQQQQRPSSCPVAAAAAAATTTPTTTAAAGLARSTDHVLTGSHVPRDSGACNHHSSSSGGGAPGTAAVDGQTTSLNWYMAAAAANNAPAFTPDQLAAVLMDAEAFYVELEKNGWCTIGAVEEAYLDFAVEDSYCLSFWAFCRLLNEASADEVEAALDLTTAQATAVLTSAVAVEEHRRAAAARQLQRLRVSPQHTSSPSSGWARQVEVVPMFLVSEYTFITFISAFIHAYWDMLESMGVDAVTQPVEMVAELTARSTTTTSPTHGSGVYEERGRGTAHQ